MGIFVRTGESPALNCVVPNIIARQCTIVEEIHLLLVLAEKVCFQCCWNRDSKLS